MTAQPQSKRPFDENRSIPLSPELLRSFSAEKGPAFTTAGLRYLNQTARAGGNRYLSILLIHQPDLFDTLMDPAQNKAGQSIALFRCLLAVDPNLDLQLAQKLPNRSNSNLAEAYQGARAVRTLLVLDETSPGRRLVPILGHLLQHPDLRTGAQATLLLGRRIQDHAWTTQIFQSADDRIRANAIESLWGLWSEEVRELLRLALKDPSNRVRGNALIGLFMAGESGIAQEIVALSRHEAPRFRMTSAWAMGRAGDPFFRPMLSGMLTDGDRLVRTAAQRSLIRIRAQRSLVTVKSEERPLEEIKKQMLEIGAFPRLSEAELREAGFELETQTALPAP